MKTIGLLLHGLALVVCAGQMQPGLATGVTLLLAAAITAAGWGLTRIRL